MESRYDYAAVGGGLAGASAIEGIREWHPSGSVLLLARDLDIPYHRPPLSKELWFGKNLEDRHSQGKLLRATGSIRATGGIRRRLQLPGGERADAARQLIVNGADATPASLRGAIR
jgi:hypothetical protein